MLFDATLIAFAIARLPLPSRVASLEARVATLDVGHDELSEVLNSLQ